MPHRCSPHRRSIFQGGGPMPRFLVLFSLVDRCMNNRAWTCSVDAPGQCPKAGLGPAAPRQRIV
eukprot:6082528-Alexandrium_andersonii.AAC.1